MSELIAEQQICPYCGRPHTHCAGQIGRRPVWRCSACSRTFWPRKKGSAIIRGIKRLLRGNTGQPA